MKRIAIATATVLAALLVSGCVGMFGHGTQRHHRSSSLVQFLYPGGAPPAQTAPPVMKLPLTVGVAFLPPVGGTGALDDAEKNRVLEQVRARFKSRAFVREIMPIPDYYLGDARGFEGLAALQRLYGLDLVALISYDQVARQEANELSLAYLTIVGAYLFPGTSQDVNTLVDLAVVDPVSRSLVLRAAGMDSRAGASTEAGSQQRLRNRSVAGFRDAAAQMIERFDTELRRFEQDVREGTSRVQFVGGGSGGGGSVDWMVLGILGSLVFSVAARRSADRDFK